MLRYALLLTLILAGCAMSVDHSPTGPGTYLITVEGADRHSHAELSRAANQRAMKLCGPAGYQVQSQSGGTQVHGSANKDSAYVGSKGSISLYIVCNGLQRSAGPARPGGPGSY